ncbi:MAG: hypothetical protein ACSW8I_04840 [bacterium]
MKSFRLSIVLMLLFGTMTPLWMSCSKDDTEESPTVAQTLSQQIQGDWKLVQCNETYTIGGSSEVYPVYEIGGLWKFFMGTDSPIGEIWINGTHKFHYIITGDMIRIYDDYTSDGYNRYTLVIANNGNSMRLMKLNSDELRLEFSKI